MVDMTSSDGPIAQVREGMTVVDCDGQTVGTIADVQMGDPEAVTSEGQGTGQQGGIVGAITKVLGPGANLPEQARERLTRLGYLRIDATGLLSGHRYAASDEIADVTSDTVRLTVPSNYLVG